MLKNNIAEFISVRKWFEDTKAWIVIKIEKKDMRQVYID